MDSICVCGYARGVHCGGVTFTAGAAAGRNGQRLVTKRNFLAVEDGERCSSSL